MPNQIPRQDDAAFWNRQMTEHALFLNLMLDEPALKRQAGQLYQLWQQTVASGRDVAVPLNELLAFKQAVLARLRSGEWLGWALPSFVQHILMEGLYYRSRRGEGTTAAADFGTWLQVVKDHADVGPKLVDPGGPDRLPAAQRVSNALGELQAQCGGGRHAGCLAAADQQIMAANAWVRGVPRGASVISPTLAAHILRENDRAAQTMRLLGGRSLGEPDAVGAQGVLDYFTGPFPASGACGVGHGHAHDDTCRAGWEGDEEGAQNGPHEHVGSTTCTAGWSTGGGFSPLSGYCGREHHHVGDPTWKPAPGEFY